MSASEKEAEGDFPDGPVVKTLSSTARGTMGSIPVQGTKIPTCCQARPRGK